MYVCAYGVPESCHWTSAPLFSAYYSPAFLWAFNVGFGGFKVVFVSTVASLSPVHYGHYELQRADPGS
jgi:hypothetical protein